MASATDAVKRHKPDLGIVFDTDVDRSAVVASSGEPINSNRYIALMAAVTLRWVCFLPAASRNQNLSSKGRHAGLTANLQDAHEYTVSFVFAHRPQVGLQAIMCVLRWRSTDLQASNNLLQQSHTPWACLLRVGACDHAYCRLG